MDVVPSPRRPAGHWPAFARLVCLAAAAAVLSGCIVVPARPYYRPAPGYYHYR